MKLAEALITRASMQTKALEFRSRLENNALVQEGELPTEDPHDLFDEYEQLLKNLENLIARINLTNATTSVDGVTITELIATKDCLKQKVSTYINFINSASQIVSRHRPTEIKIKSTVNVKEFQTKADQFSSELRKLEMKLQELNWTTELI